MFREGFGLAENIFLAMRSGNFTCWLSHCYPLAGTSDSATVYSSVATDSPAVYLLAALADWHTQQN